MTTLGARYIVATNKKNPALWNDNDRAQFFFFFFLLIKCCQYRRRLYRIIRYMESVYWSYGDILVGTMEFFSSKEKGWSFFNRLVVSDTTQDGN